MNSGYVNTDKEIWRKEENNYYSPSIHITKDKGVGINVGGKVFVKPIEEWHKLAQSQECSCEKPNYGLGHCFNFGKPIPEPKCEHIPGKSEWDGGNKYTFYKKCGESLEPNPKPKVEELDFHYSKPSPMEMVNDKLLSNNMTIQQIYQLKDKINEIVRILNQARE